MEQTKSREEEILKEIYTLSSDGTVSKLELRPLVDVESSLCSLFCYEEFERALTMVRRNTVPGRDAIEYKMIKALLV